MFLVDFEEGSSLEKNEKGLRIKSTRMEKGLSQAELAAKIRGTTKTVSDIENGKKEVTVDSIAIFGVLSIPIFQIGKDMGFPPFGKRYFLNVIKFSGLLITG